MAVVVVFFFFKITHLEPNRGVYQTDHDDKKAILIKKAFQQIFIVNNLLAITDF